MRYRTFGKTELEVSEICYGTMRYASKEGIPDEHSEAGRKALEEAIDRGVNFIHSSYEYGTRWLTGEILAKHPKRHELKHIIKVNVPDWNEPQFEETAFRLQIENALQELHTERIDIVQHLQRGMLDRALGYCQEGEPQRLAEFPSVLEKLLNIFGKLQQEGKVGYLASFPYTVGYARQTVESGAFAGMVAYFNPLETEMLEVFPSMKDRGMGFIGIRPFAAGLLTDRRLDRTKLPEDDRFQDEQWDRFYHQVSELQRAFAHSPDSWTAFAIRFALADPLITSTVVSINHPQQLHTCLSALEGEYPDPDLIEAAHQINQRFRDKFGVKANAGGVPVF